MPQVVVVRSNPAHTDPRLMKEIRALSSTYTVSVLGWDRDAKHSTSDILYSGVSIKRLRLKAPYGSLWIVLYYPIFWMWVIANLLASRPDVVHACDLDAMIPARIYGYLGRCSVVFDNFDKTAMAFISPQKKKLYWFVNLIEDIFAYKSDFLIIVSPDRLSTFRWIPETTVLVQNCPEDFDYDKMKKSIYSGTASKEFLMVYAGVIANDRGLEILEKAIRDIDGVHLKVAGRIVHKEIIDKILVNPKIEYIGLLTPDKALKLEAQADVIPILYDPEIPINRVANPNKLFEAMMLGIPVLSNVCERIINNIGCGVIVDYDIESVRCEILRFIQSPNSWVEMGILGRSAFEKKYNWTLMKRRLHEAYHSLLSQKKDDSQKII